MVMWTVFALLALACVFAYEQWRSSRGEQAMRTVAGEWGLQVERSSKRSRLFGQVGGVGVEVRHSTERTAGDVRYFTRFKIFAPDAPPGRIEAASLRQQVLNSLSDELPVSTGDVQFDEAVRVYGPEGVMRASLNADARAAVLSAVDAGWSLERATWEATEAGFVTDAEVLRSQLTLGLAAHRATRLTDAKGVDLGVPPMDPLPLIDSADATTPPASAEQALDWLRSGDLDQAFAAALLLAERGDDSQAVRLALVGALPDRQRQERAITALTKVGGQIEAMSLRAVRGEHQAAADAAAKEIEARLSAPPAR